MRLLILYLFLWLPGLASAQAPLWLVNCSNQQQSDALVCEAAQSIVLTENGQRLATTALTKRSDDEKLTATFTLPLGLFLPAGLKVTLDELSLLDMEITTCDASGCYATSELTTENVEQMTNGELLKLTVERLDRETVEFAFGLQGLAQAVSILP